MLKVEMTASVRKETGKGAMRQMRMKGMTPAVVYGAGAEALLLKLETRPFFNKLLSIYRKNAIISLNLDDGSTKHVLVQDIQTDPIKDTLLHADFIEIDVSKPRVFEVAIRYTGVAKGTDLGGILNVINDTLAIEAAPLDVPDEFVVNIADLNIGDSIKVDTIDIPENCTLVTDPESVCVSVVSLQKGTAEGEEEAEEGEGEGEAVAAAEESTEE
ncbi:50S ribosomal protein L25 [Desulfopila inferna]|uniref:50S ribosomal protein L25 n=1 Tax=Desulfopila inferna TaxID=468528 RepID=UPI0019624F7F|nr:50S ribosomal protein L25 [Desulfopila inferna]MBM9605862.1 50S ribosomal protein L25 [Desulfopila inferna]